MQHKFELISFKLCPFVQRAVITLKRKHTPFQITYIDLADRPPWFSEVSPLGKVPVLRLDDDTSLFESAVICDYLDETIPPQLHPKDPLDKAKERGWIEFGSQLLGQHFALLRESHPDKAVEGQKKLFDGLAKLEKILNADGPYFRGQDFSLVDATYAPLFMRLRLFKETWEDAPLADMPRVKRWAENLLEVPEVRESVVPEFDEEFIKYVRHQGGALTVQKLL